MFDGTTYQLLQTVTLDLDADNVRYDAKNNHIVVGYGGEKFLAGKVTRPGGGGALALLDINAKQIDNIDMDAHPESFQPERPASARRRDSSRLLWESSSSPRGANKAEPVARFSRTTRSRS
jgi:hypothetical protein